MDAVYLLGSKTGVEFKYSLRTVTNLPNVTRVVLVGPALPEYVDPDMVEWVEYPPHEKWLDLHLKFVDVINDSLISPIFYYMQDDYYVLRPVKSLPLHTSGNIMRLQAQRAPGTPYGDVTKATINELVRRGVTKVKDFELHVPTKIYKAKIRWLVNQADRTIPVHWQSMYGNLATGQRITNGINVKAVTNNDLVRLLKLNTNFLSSLDSTFETANVRKALNMMGYDKKSRFEK